MAAKLQLGWAVPKICNRRLCEEQKSFLHKIFDEGEKMGCKATPENALSKNEDAVYANRFSTSFNHMVLF